MERFDRSLAVGVDGMSSAKFKAQLDTILPTLSRKLLDGSFRFSAYKEKLILKSRDKPPRAVYIPTVRDRLVIAMLAELIKASIPPALSKVGEAKVVVRDLVKVIDRGEFDSYIKLDIKQCYPSVDHALLLRNLSQIISDQRALDLIQAALCNRVQDQITGQMCSPVTIKGVPQGLAISGLLAEFFMSEIDSLHQPAETPYRYYRFVDDVCVLCHRADRDEIQKRLLADFADLKLDAHPIGEGSDKSEIGAIDSGFQYLGYTFSKNSIGVRRSSLDKMYRRIDQAFSEYKRSEKKNKKKLNVLHKELNKRIAGLVRPDGVLIGWLAYFRYITNHEILFSLDRYIKRGCELHGVKYDESKIKKYSRAVYEIRRYPNSTYIPKIELKTFADALLEARAREALLEAESEAENEAAFLEFHQSLSAKETKKLEHEAEQYALEQIRDVESDLDLY
jgi:hypothetical protein